MKSNNLTDDVIRVEHQTPEIKINKNQDSIIMHQKMILNYISICSQFTNNYKIEEKQLKEIIDKDVLYIMIRISK